MKKPLIIVIGAVVVVLIVAGIIVLGVSANKKTTNEPTKSATSQAVTYKKVEACDVLTASIAAQLVGSDGTTTPLADTSTNSVNVSNCSYYSATSKQSVGLLVRSPLDATAAETNSGQFSSSPADAQSVTGYGTSAYWSPSYGQLNILSSDNTWYILSVGPLTPSQRTLAQAQQYADLIKASL